MIAEKCLAEVVVSTVHVFVVLGKYFEPLKSNLSLIFINSWGGTSCNTIKCPNACSNNGKCVSVLKHKLGTANTISDCLTFIDVCQCEANYTGADCSTSKSML